MPPIYVKGGVWTNVEDEILKAAVQKYGLNQWSRVASLLTKKNAKQAKARWNEWINPTINKTEWTRDEDEKLLNLVKLLPNQWRSIAPIMGRTATHCVERYQKLLEDHDDDDDNTNDLGLTGSGIESLPAAGGKVGDLNINPESKPAQPDAENLEDDDREMLFEARARLANTKGKKAKRRDRERMLEETKRISLLQKRRELKAAGINVSLVAKLRKKSKEFDYNADIPFEKTPGIGLYDTTEEDIRNKKDTDDFTRKVLKEGVELEARKEKKRKQAIEDAKGTNTTSVEGEAHVIEPAKKRTKFSIPNAQASEDDGLFAPTELAGVFTKEHKQVEDDIDGRIQKSLNDIQRAQAKPSTFIQYEETTEPRAVAKLKPKQEKKMIIELLKDSISHLPLPKNELEVLPQFEEQEEVILTKISESKQQLERLKSLQLLKEVEEVKLKLRRSQVVQRDLLIPHPNQLKPIPHTLNGIDRAIATEFQGLIKSDYMKYVDNNYQTASVEPLEEDIYEQVQHEIRQQLQDAAPPAVPAASYELPPPNTAAIAAAISTTRQSSVQISNTIAEKLPQSTAAAQITSVAQELALENANLHLYTAIAAAENSAIASRTARLNDFLEPLLKREKQLDNHLRSL